VAGIKEAEEEATAEAAEDTKVITTTPIITVTIVPVGEIEQEAVGAAGGIGLILTTSQ